MQCLNNLAKRQGEVISTEPRINDRIRVPEVRLIGYDGEQLVDDNKEKAWMALYANDRDVLETLLYRRLQTLWHDCTDALAVFTKHRACTEFCGHRHLRDADLPR